MTDEPMWFRVFYIAYLAILGAMFVYALWYGFIGSGRQRTSFNREQHIGAEIAYRIRAELVCCHVYEELGNARATMSDEDFSELLDSQGHQLCYWGEAAARLAEEHHLETPEVRPGKV